ncbi:aspartate/glutamate racemase family protein [Virgibacillus sp. W0430]|uniref:aspartate/glutamate racemase family protein n=1 Tax=Virgibacillus sp. W0430 TaxID=3391580 RepID=UPI003F480BAB
MNEKAIGILMLDTQFHRPLGDIGNKQTFSFPVVYKTVKGASVARVVNEVDRSVLDPFIHAALELEKEGVKAVTTSCGFLSIYQKEIQQRLNVPFFSSSLMQIPLAHSITGGTVGVLTASKKSLTTSHLEGVQASTYPLVIEGMDTFPAFAGAIINETVELDETLVRTEMKQATSQLIEKNSDIRSIVLECTNMPPYKNAIREITDLPIFDSTTLTNYIYQALN